MTVNEIIGLNELVNKIKSVDLKKYRDLYIPIQRFSKTYEDYLEEKFVDLMIAIESLVLIKGKGEGRSNIKEKIAIGISMLIGTTRKEKRKIRLEVEKAYEIRNDIVHGIEHPIRTKEEKLYYRVEEYLRRAIIKMLD